jgi:hypothetical protein
MSNQFHRGTFITGLVALTLGVLFTFEAAGAWTLQATHLSVVGPLAVIVIGILVLRASLRRSRT